MLFKPTFVALALTAYAVSQSLPVPACWTSCFNSVGSGGSGCTASDVGCDCNSMPWNIAIATCLDQQCPDGDKDSAFAEFGMVCDDAIATYTGTTPTASAGAPATTAGGVDTSSTPAATTSSTPAPTTSAPTLTTPTTPAPTPTTPTAASSSATSPSASPSQGGAAQITFSHGVTAMGVIFAVGAVLF